MIAGVLRRSRRRPAVWPAADGGGTSELGGELTYQWLWSSRQRRPANRSCRWL